MALSSKNLEIKGIFGQSILAEGHETDGKTVKVYFNSKYPQEFIPLSEIRFAPAFNATVKPFMNAKVEVLLDSIDFPINKMTTKSKEILVSETSKALVFHAYWPGNIVSINNERVVVLIKPNHPRVDIQPVPVETTVENLRSQMGYQYGIILNRLKSADVSIPSCIYPHRKLSWLRSDFYDYHFGNSLVRVDTSPSKMRSSEVLVSIYTNRGDIHEHVSTFFTQRWSNEKQKLNLINKINKIHGNMIESKMFKTQKIEVNSCFLSYVLGPKLGNIAQIKTTPGVINASIQDSKGSNCKRLEFKLDVSDASAIEEVKNLMEFVRIQLAFPKNMSKNILEEERLYFQRLIEETQIFSIIYDDEPAKATVELNKCLFLNIQTENVTLDMSPVSDQEYGYFLLFGISKNVYKTVKFICEKLNNIFVKSRHIQEEKGPQRPMSFGSFRSTTRPNSITKNIQRSSSVRSSKNSPSESIKSPISRQNPSRPTSNRPVSTLASPNKSVNSPVKSQVERQFREIPRNSSLNRNSMSESIDKYKTENQQRIKIFEAEINEKLRVHEKMLTQIMSLLTKNLNSENPIDFN